MGFYYHNSVSIETFRLIGGKAVGNFEATPAEKPVILAIEPV